MHIHVTFLFVKWNSIVTDMKLYGKFQDNIKFSISHLDNGYAQFGVKVDLDSTECPTS